MELQHKENVKKALSDLLKRMTIDIDGIHIPLLNKKTNQIIINCNEGEITDLKPLLRIK